MEEAAMSFRREAPGFSNDTEGKRNNVVKVRTYGRRSTEKIGRWFDEMSRRKIGGERITDANSRRRFFKITPDVSPFPVGRVTNPKAKTSYQRIVEVNRLFSD
jgi:hypothetical protein